MTDKERDLLKFLRSGPKSLAQVAIKLFDAPHLAIVERQASAMLHDCREKGLVEFTRDGWGLTSHGASALEAK